MCAHVEGVVQSGWGLTWSPRAFASCQAWAAGVTGGWRVGLGQGLGRVWGEQLQPQPQPPLLPASHSMQELYEEMKLLAFDLQDNNRIIEG